MTMNESFDTADDVISTIFKTNKVDYSSKRQEIADLFDEVLFEGNWDAITDFEDLPNLQFIQEDEYDQSMSDDEKPEWDNMICSVAGHYIFPA